MSEKRKVLETSMKETLSNTKLPKGCLKSIEEACDSHTYPYKEQVEGRADEKQNGTEDFGDKMAKNFK